MADGREPHLAVRTRGSDTAGPASRAQLSLLLYFTVKYTTFVPELPTRSRAVIRTT